MHVIYTAVQLCVVGSTFKIIHDSRVGLCAWRCDPLRTGERTSVADCVYARVFVAGW